MRTFADAEVALKESLPGYESRPQQQALAQQIEKALADGTHLLGEAGCGTGKSLAYLISAILSGRRTVVSTATKALQDQIAHKDLPFLAEHLGVRFRYAVLKGRSNYLCLTKAAAADPGQVPNLGRILGRAAEADFTGERDALGFDVSHAEWRQVAGESDDCRDNKCKDALDRTCFAEDAKRIAKDASIVVVNHALFLTDLKIREISGGAASMLDEYEAVVFDEAHEVEEYAGNALGTTFTDSGLRALATEIRNFAHRDVPAHQEVLTEMVDDLLGAVSALWAVLEPGRIRAATLIEHEDEWVDLSAALASLSDAFIGTTLLEEVGGADLEAVRKRKTRLSNRLRSTSQRLNEIIVTDFHEMVRWVEDERTQRGEKRLVLKSAPIDVSGYLRQHLFTYGPTAILVSATLAVAGKGFDYIASRLGIDAYESIDVGTPFDYSTQALLYVPTHLPDPTPANREIHASQAIMEMADLVKASDGRALLLFTSNKAMKAAKESLERMLPYTLLMQGDAPNKVLAQQFMEDESSVLLGTRSFFTGVDFQGEACSLVVMDKLPFPVPTEPITEARCEKIKADGGNDFSGYTIPVMSLILKQGFGRLIRHRTDKGVVAILDPRLKSKGYGKTIVGSLPDSPMVTTIEDVQAFFAGAA